jgi:Fe-S-cluster-containing dehydrogenase component
MARYGMAIDLDRCIGCYNCQVACKDEHVGNDFTPIAKPQPTFGHFWMGFKEQERVLSSSRIRVYYYPHMCNHCDDAPCIKAAKNGGAYKRDDGIVILDPEKAAGQKELVAACPYGAIFWNEELNTPQKCRAGSPNLLRNVSQKSCTPSIRPSLESPMPASRSQSFPAVS